MTATTDGITTVTFHDPRAWAVPGLSNWDYHGDLEHDSSSTLRLFERSTGEYYHTRITQRIKRKKETDEMRLGTAGHIGLIEPEKLHELIAVIPTEVLSKNGAKSGSKYELFAWKHRGKVLLKQEEYDLLRWKVDAVRENPHARELLDTCNLREHSIFFVTAEGYKLKVRLDLGSEMAALIGDVKHCGRGRFRWKSIEDFGYIPQAALYCWGFEHLYGTWPEFRHIWVNPNPPFETEVTVVTREQIAAGMAANHHTLRRIYECRAGVRPWIAPPGPIQPLSVRDRTIEELYRDDEDIFEEPTSGRNEY